MLGKRSGDGLVPFVQYAVELLGDEAVPAVFY
jgi:hypothetical protein